MNIEISSNIKMDDEKVGITVYNRTIHIDDALLLKDDQYYNLIEEMLKKVCISFDMFTWTMKNVKEIINKIGEQYGSNKK